MNHDLTQALETIETERINAVNDVLDAMSNLNHKYEQLMNTEVDITEEWFQQYALFYDLQNDLVSVFNESDIDEIVKSYEDIDEQCIMESTNETRPGLLKRLLEAIKNFFKKIGERISKIINWIKGSKLPKKTIDQICSEVIKSKSAITEAVDDSLHIDFPAMPGSVIHSKQLHVLSKQLDVKIKNGIVELNPIGFNGSDMITTELKNPTVVISSLFLFDRMINDISRFRTKLEYVIGKTIIDNNQLKRDANYDTYLSDLLKIYNESCTNRYFVNPIEIKYDQISKINSYVHEITAKITNIDSCNFSQADSNRILVLVKIIERITYGCNMVAASINGIYMCDRKYANSIKSIDELSKFVESCITIGIPYNHIAYNTWVVMSNEFDNRTYWSKSDVSPRWGQSRVVFYPKTDKSVILKVAMNSYGILCNKHEFEVYNQYENVGIADQYLAKILDCTANYCVMVMDKHNISNVSYSDMEDLGTRLKNEWNNNKSLYEIKDIHLGNVGYSIPDKTLHVIDYAGR